MDDSRSALRPDGRPVRPRRDWLQIGILGVITSGAGLRMWGEGSGGPTNVAVFLVGLVSVAVLLLRSSDVFDRW